LREPRDLVTPSPSQILLVTELFPPFVGGSAVLMKNIYSRVSGPSVTVLTDGDPNTQPEVDGTLSILRRPMKMAHWGVLQPTALATHLRTAALIRSLTSGQRAIVHCGRALPEGLPALMARAIGGPRYLCWTHGEELGYVQTSRELRALLARVHRAAAAVVANSHNTCSKLETFGVPRPRIHVVEPGVDPQRFRPDTDAGDLRRRLAPDGEVVMLTVGRLQARKGHDLAIAALDALRREIPKLRYVIVGDGEERQRLETMVADRALGERVTFAGKAEEADLPRYYAAADLFVHPNRLEGNDFEGFGIVFLEASSSGLAVIGGASGGVPEAVAADVSGLLVHGDDVPELAAAIRRLVADPELRRRMGRAGRERVLNYFTWERAARQIGDLQAGLVESGRLPA
jgi:phosphatidylinositol alpha-1,6-mannosyltransferase